MYRDRFLSIMMQAAAPDSRFIRSVGTVYLLDDRKLIDHYNRELRRRRIEINLFDDGDRLGLLCKALEARSGNFTTAEATALAHLKDDLIDRRADDLRMHASLVDRIAAIVDGRPGPPEAVQDGAWKGYATAACIVLGLMFQPGEASAARHTVKAGESLTAIARQYGLDVQELSRVNNIQYCAKRNWYPLYPGQALDIPLKKSPPVEALVTEIPGPAKAAPSPTEPAVEAAVPDMEVEPSLGYTALAEAAPLPDWSLTTPESAPEPALGVLSVSDAKAGRAGEGNAPEGDLAIEAAEAGTVAYVVRRNDTLPLIASRVGISETEIVKHNRLSGKRLVRGKALKLPPHAERKSGRQFTDLSPLEKIDFLKDRTIEEGHPYIDMVVRVSAEEHIDPRLVMAIVWQESTFNPRAVSPDKCFGLMQVKGGSRKASPELMVRRGIEEFKRSYAKYRGDGQDVRTSVIRALAAFNAGEHRIDRQIRKGAWDGRNPKTIPYRETRRYVVGVLDRCRDHYSALL